MVLPAGFELPPLPYLLPTLVVLLGSAAMLWTLRPTVSDRLVLAIVPWMVAGGAAHALYMVGALPPLIEPLFGVPGVYLTMGALGGVIWLFALVTTSRQGYHMPATYLFVSGSLAAAIALIAVVSWGAAEGELVLRWTLVGLLLAIVFTGVAWLLVSRQFPRTAELSAWTGLVVIFGHALDGISTAIGIDILDGAERSPIADGMIWVGSLLPTSGYIGDTWVFVLVKFALPIAVLVLFREYLDEAPSQARLLLAIVAAVGLGPGVHNLMLFMLSM